MEAFRGCRMGMKQVAVVLGFWAALGPAICAAQERPVLAQEYKPEGARPGFWWTRRVEEYTLQFFGTMVAPRVNRVALPQPAPAPVAAADALATLDRSSFFIGNTIANLRGLDPTFGCRTLTLIDGRRVVNTGSATSPGGGASPPQPVPQMPASKPMGNVAWQVWLLKGDGTVILPQRRSPADAKYCDTGLVYGFELSVARDAVAVAFSDGDNYFVQQLQPFADQQD